MNYLVTGCSRGVGLEVCRVLLEQGHVVYGIARSYSKEFQELEIKHSGRIFLQVLICQTRLISVCLYLRILLQIKCNYMAL